MDNRRDFIKKASILSTGAGLLNVLPSAVARALAIDPAPGSTYLDAEHVVFLMQENRSFDHAFGTLQGVRGFNDPRAIQLPNGNPVWLQTNKEGQTYAPFRFDIKGSKATWMSSLPHTWTNQVDARNGGHYDRWLDVKVSGKEEYASMPLTMGYYSRKDIPFYYSLADAFTICDQHFCSSLTGTTPNRLFFWTGTIREKADERVLARVWNEDIDQDTPVSWKTFPERLEELGVEWKIYQNEIAAGVGFEGEEDAWLANFGDSPIEAFSQYHVKLAPEFIANLPKEEIKLKEGLQKHEVELQSLTVGTEDWKKKTREIKWYKKRIEINAEDQRTCTPEKFAALPEHEKNIHRRAFTNNRLDPDYHSLEDLSYNDNGEQRTMKVPKGDVLHQFREDVSSGKLPTVSWIVAPENFSDHPSAAWYGAWYISEVMDILTKNPEVWKKTIFVLTYDENDGYFDHHPPFVAPDPRNKETGLCSSSIDTSLDWVSDAAQQSRTKDDVRISPIGLGYRVPMVIASPWSRGGWVNSEVFDHTSTLRLLENFLGHRLGKKVEESNISPWRRAVCGDLTSVFRPYHNESINKPRFLQRDEFLEAIHKAQFKNPPSNFKALTAAQVNLIRKDPRNAAGLPVQEKGIRDACALPYELYADGNFDRDKRAFVISYGAGNDVFGEAAAGAPFTTYMVRKFKGATMRSRSYAVLPGDNISDQWAIADFDESRYHLRCYGPNGFFREFTGDAMNPALQVKCKYQGSVTGKQTLTGAIELLIENKSGSAEIVEIVDNAYKHATKVQTLKRGLTILAMDTSRSFGWYDFTIRLKGKTAWTQRYAGRVERGLPSKTDPFMGRVL